MGVPIQKKKSRDEITIITETGKTPERNDTICGSPSLFSSSHTGAKIAKMTILMLLCEIDISSRQKTPNVRSARQCQYFVTSPPALINATTLLGVPFLCDVLPPWIFAADLTTQVRCLFP